MNEFNHLMSVMRRILNSEVVLGPAVASAGVGGLDEHAYGIVYENAAELTREICNNRPFTLPMYPGIQVSPPMVRSTLVECLSSTAAYLSHIRLGYLHIDEPMILVAHRLLQMAFRENQMYDVLTLSFMVNAYDNCKVVQHYGRVLNEEFVSGELHRPWIQYSLDLELAVHLLTGTMKIVTEDAQQYVVLTEVGEERHKQFAEFLKESGFLRRRTDLARRSQFSQLVEYDEMMQSLGNLEQLRQDILRESGITSGMRVLELGCGTGEMTLTSGLYKLPGANGQVVATDPSVGMLARARDKLALYPDANVKFVEAPAEDLPFADNTFDAVVGCAFMHFTNIPVVLREVYRVAKPGATFTTIYGLKFPQDNDFFLEWFAPVLELFESTGEEHALPSEDFVRTAIRDIPYEDVRIEPYEAITCYDQPEMVVKFLIQVGNLFDGVMEKMPWKAQQDMMELLIARGQRVLEKYGSERLVQVHPEQFLQARVMK